jgi:hypothetical protein
MKTLCAIVALVAHEARIADVAGLEQPDPRQGDAGVRRKTSNDGLQYVLQIALRRHGDGKTQKPVIFHQETCQAVHRPVARTPRTCPTQIIER